MKISLNLKFTILNGKIESECSLTNNAKYSQIKYENGTTYITIGDLVFGFLEISYSSDLITITSDEFCSFPVYYVCSSNVLLISNNLKSLSNTSNFSVSDINDFICNGYFFESTGFSNIHITKPQSKITFDLRNNQFNESKQKVQLLDSINHNYSFDQLYEDLVLSVEHLLRTTEYQTVDLTGGVDTRLILGMLFDLGYENRYTYVTDKTDVSDRRHDFEIASQICSKYQLRHENKYQASFDQLKCLSGKYGSEFFSGEFSNFWGEYQSNHRINHYPNLPYLENHISPLNDLYFIYGTCSFIDSVSNLYCISNTPYKMRNSLMSLNKIPLESQKSYAFHNFIFNHRLKWLSKFPFFSNFANFNNNFQFIKKEISPKDSSTYQVDNFITIELLKNHCDLINNDTQLSLFDKKIRLARIKLLDEYYKKHIA